MLGAFDTELFLGLTLFAFQTQDDLTCGFGLFVEDGLGLSTESHLFGVVTALTLRKVGCLAGLVLCDLVETVSLAGLAGTIGSAFFWDVDHGVVFEMSREGGVERSLNTK
eukprot:CAMPEP_0202448360 /NCGR_PEP_ID=MMETSP1360-20130828/7173_1 /ASSEMBLY_ACC=CAM_ASM_000848 /TAXON_ID=515479 /ORGANISM="Licmophora paradoxa, Strain CCMP2313" /LENGTH=109 /DNA_ID=CAMNT_0049065889 /DNA_START=108 /DNA_END=437 /DNA_ORIENTATION=-